MSMVDSDEDDFEPADESPSSASLENESDASPSPSAASRAGVEPELPDDQLAGSSALRRSVAGESGERSPGSSASSSSGALLSVSPEVSVTEMATPAPAVPATIARPTPTSQGATANEGSQP